MVDFTQIDGVGDTMAERLGERFDSFEELANAELDELTDIDYITEDRAMNYRVEADNLIEDESNSGEEAVDESEDELPSSEELAELDDASDDGEPSEDSDDDSSEEETVDEANGPKSVTMEFTGLQYDLTITALVNDVASVYNSNPSRKESGEWLLSQMRRGSDGAVTFDDMEQRHANTMHSAVRQLRNRYQGENIVEWMDELKDVEERVNEVRKEF